jgi:hypothetical protein
MVWCVAALVGLLTYAIFMPCCEDMLIETTFRLRNQVHVHQGWGPTNPGMDCLPDP